ncbi:MAG: PVC-type heme-binding CxxCH protein [Pirellula sp.]
MRTNFIRMALVVWLAVSYRAPVSFGQISNTTTIGNITYTIADGLQFERVVDESLLQWPIAATFHENGDLLVLECHWTREPVKKQLESRPHKIVRLTDSDGDRKYDKRTVIAEKLGFPEGIMVFGKDLLVTAPPEILRLSDKDGDGFYEGREVWFDAATLTNCANDLHGPMMGLDGWVYWTKGAFAEQNHDLIRRSDKSEGDIPPSKAAHIYRRHPKGGPVERLMSGGMDNPSDLTFSVEGEIFFCSTFLHHPGNGLRDGIAHSPRGGLFGKQHQVLDGHKTTGPILQPITNLGPAAPASVNYLATATIPTSTAWYQQPSSLPPGADRFLVSSQFNLQRIGLHRLIPSGASFTTENHDLIAADRIDFHPTDTLEEKDGSLLVFDTGGWYDLCCPSSGKDTDIARGGIYRLSPKSKPTSAITIPKLSLGEATEWASNRNKPANDRKLAIWRIATEITSTATSAASSSNNTELSKLVISLLSDPDPTIGQTAAHVVGLNRWREAVIPITKLLDSPAPASVRSALEAIGVIGDHQSVAPILSTVARFPDDRFIVHSSIYALMEIGASDEMNRVAEIETDDHRRHAVVYALDQMKRLPDNLLPPLVRSLASPNEKMRDLAIKCLARRPNGITLSLPYIQTAWNKEDAKSLAAVTSLVQAGASNSELRDQIAKWIHEGPTLTLVRQDWLLECIQKTGADALPTAWANPLVEWIGGCKSDAALIQIANAIKQAKFANEDREPVAQALSQCANRCIDKPKVALSLLAACPNLSIKHSEACSALIVKQLVGDETDPALAESALSRSTIQKEAATKLLGGIESVPPLYLQSAIDSILRCNDSALDTSLVTKLATVPAVKTLSIDRVMPILSKRTDAFRQQWIGMMQAAAKPPEDIAKSLDTWLERLPSGDPAKGYHVFRSAKAACSSCHQVGYIGGRLGPELSKIGKSRTRRDLVEAIVFPSFRMAQGYYPIRIRTVDDEVFNGLMSKQTDSYVELVCGVDKICRVAKEDIADQTESQVSVMPTGLDQLMTVNELADLIAFLESKK